MQVSTVKVRVKGKEEEDASKRETRERGRRGRVLVAIDLSSHSVSVYGALLTLTPCVPVSAAFPLPPVEAGMCLVASLSHGCVVAGPGLDAHAKAEGRRKVMFRGTCKGGEQEEGHAQGQRHMQRREGGRSRGWMEALAE